MARTQLGGNRLAPKSIETKHLAEGFVIPEKQLVLDHPTHNHENKTALDILKNSVPTTLTSLDLKDVMLTILEVAEARLNGQTLKNTISAKANKDIVDAILQEINVARGNYASLDEAIRVVISEASDIINNHAGIVGHYELDLLYNEVQHARGVYPTLKERLDNTLGGGGTGTVNISMLTPWNYEVTLAAGQTEIELPNSYTIGNNNLQVFEGPMLLYPGSANDYTETTPTKITLNYELPEGTQLRFIGLGAGTLFEWVIYTSSTNGQTVIDLLDSYRPGQRELHVYEDGLLLQPEVDYIEETPTRLTFTIPFPSGCNIAIFKRRY